MVNKKAIVLVAILILVFTTNFNEVSASWFGDFLNKINGGKQFSPNINALEPSNWIELFSSSMPVENGILLSEFNPGVLSDGEYTLRLLVQ